MKIVLKDGTTYAVEHLSESIHAGEFSLNMNMDPANKLGLRDYAKGFRDENIGEIEVLDDEGSTMDVLEDYVSASVGRLVEDGQFVVNVTLHKPA